MPEEQNVLRLTGSLSEGGEALTAAYRFPITIINKSSMGFQKAEVACKDEGTGTVDTAYFGHIPAGGSQQQTVSLPGGIEFVIWKILPDVGKEIYGFGAGDNAGGVDITIND